jgi:hypothetical protein
MSVLDSEALVTLHLLLLLPYGLFHRATRERGFPHATRLDSFLRFTGCFFGLLLALKMEAVRSFQISVNFYRTTVITRILEDSENLKPNINMSSLQECKD